MRAFETGDDTVTSTKEQQRRVRDYRARRTVHERSQRRLTRDNVIAVAAVVVVGTLAGLGQWWYASSQPTDDAATASESPAPSDEATATEAVPDPSLAEDRMWTGSMTIDGVELGIELDGEAAPQAVSAVINDIQTGYYPGKTCHRLTTAERFEVLQCGSIDGTGAGDPDYQYGPIENAPADDVYPAGTIAMARAGGDANSNGHQFFIVYGDTDIPADAAGGYTVIGQVTSGLDQLVTDVIAKGTKPDEATGVAPQDGEPLEPVTIDAISVQ